MSIISNNDIQAGLIQILKTNAPIIAVVSVTEIRESQWQGTDFVYPAIRVQVAENSPMADSACSTSIVKASIWVFTEDDSSFDCNDFAGIIANELHGHSFNSNSLAFASRVSKIVPARRSELRTWRSEVQISCLVSQTV